MRRTAVVSSIALCETHELSNQLLLQLLLHGQFINQSNVCSHATRSASSTNARNCWSWPYKAPGCAASRPRLTPVAPVHTCT